MNKITLLLLTVAAGLASCKARDSSSLKEVATASSDSPTAFGTCVALRGNGPAMMGHFASLARISEHFGPIDAMAGGSSASVTQFLYESIRLNPEVSDCKDCRDPAIAGARISLLLKSLQGYFEALADSPEGLALQGLIAVFPPDRYKTVLTEITRLNFGERDALVVAAALAVLRDPTEGKIAAFLRFAPVFSPAEIAALSKHASTVLGSGESGALNAREWLTLFEHSQNRSFHAKELMTAFANFGRFAPDTQTVLHRPGLLSFEKLAGNFNRIGSFYAQADLGAYLDACALPTRGLVWRDVAQQKTTLGPTCGALFHDLAVSFRKSYKQREVAGTAKLRVDDAVGETVRAFPVTAVLKGKGHETFLRERAAYDAGRDPQSLAVEAEGNSYGDSVAIGYWGDAALLGKVGSNPRGYTDQKTKLFQPLGPMTWRTVLALSPAEPGLSNLRPMADGMTSIAGWHDLAPVLALKNAGCDKVIYVTSRWDATVDNGFDYKMARLLGAQQGTLDALFKASLDRSLAEADGVWCTDWNAHFDSALTDPDPLFADAFAADFLVKDRARFEDLRAADGKAYDKVSTDLKLPQCSAE